MSEQAVDVDQVSPVEPVGEDASIRKELGDFCKCGVCDGGVE
jgi:hypothetical protein